MTKDDERKRIVEAMGTAETEEEMKEVLKSVGFEFKQPAKENDSKKKANI